MPQDRDRSIQPTFCKGDPTRTKITARMKAGRIASSRAKCNKCGWSIEKAFHPVGLARSISRHFGNKVEIERQGGQFRVVLGKK